MKNSFNIEVCFKSAPIECYEWEKSSFLLHVKAMRVSTKTLTDILMYEGSISSNTNLLLLSDTCNAIAIKLDKDGNIGKRSFLKYDDALDVCEYANNLKETKLSFKKSNKKVKYPMSLSIEDELKKYILNSIKMTKDEDLIKYLYYLYYDKIEDYSSEKLIKAVKTSSLDKNMKLYKFLIES